MSRLNHVYIVISISNRYSYFSWIVLLYKLYNISFLSRRGTVNKDS